MFGLLFEWPFKTAFTVTICILNTRKWELWQTIKTQMKCCRMQHFIRVCTVCLVKLENLSSEKELHFYLEIKACHSLVYTRDHTDLNQTLWKIPLV